MLLIFCFEVPVSYEFIGHSGLRAWFCCRLLDSVNGDAVYFFVNEFMSWVLSLFYLNETFAPHNVARSVMYVESTRVR